MPDNLEKGQTAILITIIDDQYEEQALFSLFDFVFDCARCGMTRLDIGELIEKLKIKGTDGLRPSFGMFPKTFDVIDIKQRESILRFALDCWIRDLKEVSCSALLLVLDRRVEQLRRSIIHESIGDELI